MIGQIVTGTEERVLNGPFKPPFWDGQPGTRNGQLAYDDTGAVDGVAGHIYWDGTIWQKIGGNTKEYADNTIFGVASPTGKFTRQADRLHGIYNAANNVTYTYDKVTLGPDGLAMNDSWVDGKYYVKYLPTGEYFKADISGRLRVDFFGAIGGAYYRDGSGNLYTKPVFIPANAAPDDTIAIQKAINVAVWTGKDLLMEQTHYQITDTLNIPGPPSSTSPIRSLSMYSQGTGGFSYLRFKNSVANKNMFTIGNGMSYMIFDRIAFRDEISYTSKFMTLTSTTASPALTPLWKIGFYNFRFETFKVGMHFMGDATDYTKDSLLDGCTFMHGKFRECATSCIYENTQAVNHAYYNVDFENGSATDISQKFKIFHMRKGSVINHYGGSVIGAGAYVYIEPLSTGYFQATSQFNSWGVRIEQRTTLTPIIHHAETSTVSVSNSLRVNLNGMSIFSSAAPAGDKILAKIGGQINLVCDNIRTSAQYYVYGAITQAIASNFNYGSIVIRDSYLISYKKYSPTGTEYQSVAVSGTNLTDIPCYIENKTEGAAITGVSGYILANNTAINVLPGSFSNAPSKFFTYRDLNTNGIGAGTTGVAARLILSQYARPYKFSIIKKGAQQNIPFVLSLSIVVGGVDYLVASIDTTSFFGYAEVPITPSNTAVDDLYVDGTTWDGKIALSKDGSIIGFTGLIMIHYI